MYVSAILFLLYGMGHWFIDHNVANIMKTSWGGNVNNITRYINVLMSVFGVHVQNHTIPAVSEVCVSPRRVTVNIQRCRWVYKWEKPSSVECTLPLERTPATRTFRVPCVSPFCCWAGQDGCCSVPEAVPADQSSKRLYSASTVCHSSGSWFTFIAVGGFYLFDSPDNEWELWPLLH